MTVLIFRTRFTNSSDVNSAALNLLINPMNYRIKPHIKFSLFIAPILVLKTKLIELIGYKSDATCNELQAKARITDGGGAAVLKQVNYVLLDLDKGSDSTTTASMTAHPISPQGSVASFAESPQHRISAAICSAVATQTPSATVLTAEGYATIDFDRTAALSNTAASSLVTEEEGLRKTRHNSTMASSSLFSLNRQTSSVSD